MEILITLGGLLTMLAATDYIIRGLNEISRRYHPDRDRDGFTAAGALFNLGWWVALFLSLVGVEFIYTALPLAVKAVVAAVAGAKVVSLGYTLYRAHRDTN